MTASPTATVVTVHRRPDLVLSRPAETQHKTQSNPRERTVVKDPQSGKYFQLGPEETFLLLQLDGTRSPNEVCEAFGKEFGGSLAEDELAGFIEMGLRKGLLVATPRSPETFQLQTDQVSPSQRQPEFRTVDPPAANSRPALLSRLLQRALYWRIRLLDPERFLCWMEPKIRFVWTPTF